MHSIFSLVEVSPWMHAVLVGDDAIAMIEEKEGKIVVWCKYIALKHMRELALGLSYAVGHTIEESSVMRMIQGVELGMTDGTMLACKFVEE